MSLVNNEDYEDEPIRLTRDPIIRAMAEEIRPALEAGGVDLAGWDFMLKASKEYTRRGGQEARTVGGPAVAIRLILEGDR